MNIATILLSALISTASDTTINLSDVEVTASFKTANRLQSMPLSSSSFNMMQIERQQIVDITDFAAVTPNLHIPDYGSKMTSSIYIRGIGSRIDNPAIGMYVDMVPYLNKNAYDASLWDVRRIDVIRGPQGTLYGRNTIGGIINITTLSAFDYHGTRAQVTGGNGDNINVSVATYNRASDRFGMVIGLNANYSGGFFTNEYTADKCDWEKSFGGRVRLTWREVGNWNIDNTFKAEYSTEGGYAYAQYDTATQKVLPIAYNDECSYTRTHVSNGFVAQSKFNKIQVQNILAYQYLSDDMILDQDFTTKNMFTLQQIQREHVVNKEFLVRNINQELKWQWLSGASFFFKHNTMPATVTFKSDGINELILANANKGLQTVFQNDSLSFRDNNLAVNSLFVTPTIGAAVFHQSEYKFGNFNFTAGIRFDYEHIGFKYKNWAELYYNFSYTMKSYKQLRSVLNGKEQQHFVEILPKMILKYNFTNSSIYTSLSKGYKSGGYNSQMFSDILQNQLKSDLMSSLGVYFDNATSNYSVDDVISYKPEHNWNFELGTSFTCFDKRIEGSATLFYILCRHQQLTIFPNKESTGRMMTNAGKTRSFGAETALSVNIAKCVKLNGTYGYTNARFVEYDNGINNFAKKYLPYAPIHTVSGEISFVHQFKPKINHSDWRQINQFALNLLYSGVGKIYWNEENNVWQDYYSQFGASAKISSNAWSLSLWGKNLTNTNYSNFYFVSVGKTYLSKGKPIQYGITLKFYL